MTDKLEYELIYGEKYLLGEKKIEAVYLGISDKYHNFTYRTADKEQKNQIKLPIAVTRIKKRNLIIDGMIVQDKSNKYETYLINFRQNPQSDLQRAENALWELESLALTRKEETER